MHGTHNYRWSSQPWWNMSVMLVLRRQAQEDHCKFKANIIYIEFQAIWGYIAIPCFKNKRAKHTSKEHPLRYDSMIGG